MPCDSLSHLITPYPLGWKQNYFHLATLKLVPRPQFFLSYFITPCHSLSHLITTYALGWKKNQFNLETLKLVPRSLISFHILSRLSTPYHTLSPRLETKPFQLTNVKVDPRL